MTTIDKEEYLKNIQSEIDDIDEELRDVTHLPIAESLLIEEKNKLIYKYNKVENI
jgi:hypothetical protein